ncbi:hypothetical protein L211DRAFT_87961 [Terfezia boudieri ATCC MYA-4762]|uniref:Uncharacterized protein n=1 Tax=Terfezia boudieri ATCC MYA-4762 TaxID=1051890 RepID=A0A3N4LRL1_9PEZI|nr:hypothetical protein L211DRAFT_87961 [Terfezia boudieri ATCC MYA-4762]
MLVVRRRTGDRKTGWGVYSMRLGQLLLCVMWQRWQCNMQFGTVMCSTLYCTGIVLFSTENKHCTEWSTGNNNPIVNPPLCFSVSYSSFFFFFLYFFLFFIFLFLLLFFLLY